jgi:prepilin-type N-terminal cleavage/methylation domain-containing protein
VAGVLGLEGAAPFGACAGGGDACREMEGMMKRKGYTLVEVLIVLAAVTALAALGAMIFTFGHFLAKVW